MSAEHGQASIEWIGGVLLVALTLAGLAALAGRGEGADIALAGLRATTCATVAGATATDCLKSARPARPFSGAGPPSADRAQGAVTVPPPLPPPALGDGQRPDRARRPLAPPRLRARLRAHFVAAWRRAWLACLAYERVRYALRHPETRVRQNVPIRAVLRMANDCLSPIDLARDLERPAVR